MRRTPNTPIVGEGLSANFARDIIRELRANRIIAGKNITVDYTPNGTRINGTPGGVKAATVTAKETLKPFAIRWFSYDTDPEHPNPNAGEWQIYMPHGCLSLRSYFGTGSQQALACIPANDAATDDEGNEIYQWFKIPDPVIADAYSTTLDGHAALSWPVRIRMAPWPICEITTKSTGDTVKTVFNGGLLQVGSIYIVESEDKDGNTVKTRSAYQWYESGQTITRDDYSTLSITYKTDDNVTSKDAEWKPYLTKQHFIFGRKTLDIDDDTDISDFTEVVVHITHEDEEFEVEVIDAEDAEENDDDNTYISIYDLSDNVPTADNRSRVTNVPWYNS